MTTTNHYRADATDIALSRVLGRMSASEAQRLYDNAAATGRTIREVIGHVAARAHLWQFVDLVFTERSTAPMNHPAYACDPAEMDGDPDDHDPVSFAAENGDVETAAQELRYGDVYRKSLLGLDEVAAAELGAHLRTRGLELVDDDTHWVIGRRGDGGNDDDTQPAAPPPTTPLHEEPAPAPCPECGKPAAIGRDTCGDDACVEDYGRKALAILRAPKKDAP